MVMVPFRQSVSRLNRFISLHTKGITLLVSGPGMSAGPNIMFTMMPTVLLSAWDTGPALTLPGCAVG